MFQQSTFAASVLLLAAFGAVDAAPQQFGDYTVAVAADPAAATGVKALAYEITVENTGLTLARLTAPYHGTLSNSFVADLNHDGAFEVVVTFSDEGGHATDVKVYSWKGDLLQPLKVAELAETQRQGYRGDDEFAVTDGKLIRVFQVYEQHGSEWTPTANRRKLHYSFEDPRWVSD